MMADDNKPNHYVNNHDFSWAVVDYVKKVQEAEECGEEPPQVPDYIARCFLNIAEGLSYKKNFWRYTYREEMVMDAVENCLKAVNNYNIEAATRTGKPNAFSYFTKISWYAFLRRIEKEKKQADVRTKYLAESGIETMIDGEDMSNPGVVSLLDQLKLKIEKQKEKDTTIKEMKKSDKKQKRMKKSNTSSDSDLTEHLT
jgi:hypothetical protein